jgi:precorrin-2 dehydrogenase/sirohydrochlorin ferrochelatase
MVASGRLFNLLRADALVTVIVPSKQLHPEVKYRIHEDSTISARITCLDEVCSGKQDLKGTKMVLTAIDDNEQSLSIWRDAKDLRIAVNVADVPPNCDFYFGSLIRREPLQILVSMNGKGPKLASLIRQRVEESLPENVKSAIKRVGVLREKLRERAPEVGGKLGKERLK